MKTSPPEKAHSKSGKGENAIPFSSKGPHCWGPPQPGIRAFTVAAQRRNSTGLPPPCETLAIPCHDSTELRVACIP
jgi:hypothetical protein